MGNILALLLCVTIKVPADYPTIQQGVTAAVSGDTVLVAPGVYNENIVFVASNNGMKLISEAGPESTEIHSPSGGAVLQASRETGLDTSTLVEGFKVTGGTGGYDGEGGGVRLWGDNMTFRGNIFTNNTANEGAGLYLEKSDAVVDGNLIYGNTSSGADGNGGGIFCFADYGGPYYPVIKNNIIRNNHAAAQNTMVSGGGAITIVKVNAIIENNLIYDNTADDGVGGISLFGQAYETPVIRYNTIRDNDSIGINIRSKVNVKINYNNITGHKKYGVAYLFFVKMTIDAENNWWGSSSGPYHPTLNAGGTGNAATDSIDFTPWLSDTVAIEENAKIKNQNVKIKVSPNPFIYSTVVSFESQQNTGQDFNLAVYDVSGKIINSINSKNLANSIILDGENLKSGIYFVKARIGTHTLSEKIIKTR